MTFLTSLFDSGADYTVDSSERRSVQLSNRISIILVLLSAILTVLYTVWYGWVIIAKIIPVAGLLCLAPVILNRAGLTLLSRLWLSLILSLSATSISVYSKLEYYQTVRELDYFAFRFFLLAGCVIPPILFSFKEKFPLWTTSLLTFALLMVYDPIHLYFGVPYPDLQLNRSSYDFTNIIVFIVYCIIVGAIFFLKIISERNEDKSDQLIAELNRINSELEEKNSEIEAQSSEIQAQSEALMHNQKKLEEANQLVEGQKNQLADENQGLASELLAKNNILIQTNNELISHNNELSQFSYTVSHNLRGPVASLLGLLQMIEQHDGTTERQEILHHLRNSANKLDTIIRDLGKIIDIRNDIFRVRQKINLEEELESIQNILKKEIQSVGTTFKIDISRATEIYSVRPMVVSILYNLISNALKYRSLERDPVIEVTADKDDRFFIISVKDNGLGIDLERHRDSLFKMYKRFHHHLDGKGLGLYLVKMQAEALHGRIEVSSQINSFTMFKVFIGIPENIEEQVLLDESFAKIFYDATLNCTGVIWRGPITGDQYKTTYLHGIEFLKAYNTPNWITDLTNQGHVDPADQQWLFREIIPIGVRNGLARIAGVRPPVLDEPTDAYLKGIEHSLRILGITFRSFATFPEACEWIRTENANTSLKKKSVLHE
jgi:signal transduction histidine kinase